MPDLNISSRIWRATMVVVGLALTTWFVTAGELKITLPPELNRFKPGPGSEIAAAQCVICHSADYISTQPPLPRAFWKAGVQKMQKIYGAPLPEAQVEPLVDYLVKNYGNEKPSATGASTKPIGGK